MATKNLRGSRGKAAIPTKVPLGDSTAAITTGTPYVISRTTPGDWESFIKTKLEEAEKLRPKIRIVDDPAEHGDRQRREGARRAQARCRGHQLWENDDGTETHLQFQKHGNEWRLCVITEAENDPDPSHAQFGLLANATRDTRLEAVGALGFLLDEMVAQVIIEMQEINDKVNNGSQFVAALNSFNKSNSERVGQAMDTALAQVEAEFHAKTRSGPVDDTGYKAQIEEALEQKKTAVEPKESFAARMLRVTTNAKEGRK